MFLSLWRRLRSRPAVPCKGGPLAGGRPLSWPPQLEPLEDRLLPALATGGILQLAAVPAAVSGLQPTGIKPPGSNGPIPVTVAENAPPTVIDLGPVFGAMSGIRPGNGLKLSILGNTNSSLVKTDLSEAALTLTFAPGKWGTATITVRATDADGVSVQQTILVTVGPLGLPGPVGATPVSVRPQLLGTPGTLP